MASYRHSSLSAVVLAFPFLRMRMLLSKGIFRVSHTINLNHVAYLFYRYAAEDPATCSGEEVTDRGLREHIRVYRDRGNG